MRHIRNSHVHKRISRVIASAPDEIFCSGSVLVVLMRDRVDEIGVRVRLGREDVIRRT
jgi:hypothetical protein